MNELIRLLCLTIGAFVLGIGITIAGISALARRHGSSSEAEGCFTNSILLTTVVIAAFFFYLAVT